MTWTVDAANAPSLLEQYDALLLRHHTTRSETWIAANECHFSLNYPRASFVNLHCCGNLKTLHSVSHSCHQTKKCSGSRFHCMCNYTALWSMEMVKWLLYQSSDKWNPKFCNIFALQTDVMKHGGRNQSFIVDSDIRPLDKLFSLLKQLCKAEIGFVLGCCFA